MCVWEHINATLSSCATTRKSCRLAYGVLHQGMLSILICHAMTKTISGVNLLTSWKQAGCHLTNRIYSFALDLPTDRAHPSAYCCFQIALSSHTRRAQVLSLRSRVFPRDASLDETERSRQHYGMMDCCKVG